MRAENEYWPGGIVPGEKCDIAFLVDDEIVRVRKVAKAVHSM